ncbi:MAG: hypothetical protein VYA34_00630 [Myxococcota bacterium]|nr:hypothetical protein [Myxococcota bacterium]
MKMSDVKNPIVSRGGQQKVAAETKTNATIVSVKNEDVLSSVPTGLSLSRGSVSPRLPARSLERKKPAAVYYMKTGEWGPTDPVCVPYPHATSVSAPIVDSIPLNQHVRCIIGDQIVEGRFDGWDYKARPKIKTDSGTRIGTWEKIEVVGTCRKVIPARTMEGLPATNILKPPARLKRALKKAMQQKVTGTHTANEYLEAFHREGYPMYVVGGAIRDAIYLLKQKPEATDKEIIDLMKDIDVVTTAPPAVSRRIAKEVAPEYDGAIFSPEIVDQFGCVLVGGSKAGLPDSAGIDIVSIRDGFVTGRPQFHPDTAEKAIPGTFGYRLVDDVNGRDFTCNSLYYDPLSETIIDPTGSGIADAQNKILRLVDEKWLSYDSNTIFRYYKFKLRGFSGAPHQRALMRRTGFKSLRKQSEWKVIANITKIAPKGIATKKEARAFLEELRMSMTEDGNGDLYAQFIEPVEDKITTLIERKHRYISEGTSYWTYALYATGAGAIGTAAVAYLNPDARKALTDVWVVAKPKVEKKLEEFKERAESMVSEENRAIVSSLWGYAANSIGSYFR